MLDVQINMSNSQDDIGGLKKLLGAAPLLDAEPPDYGSKEHMLIWHFPSRLTRKRISTQGRHSRRGLYREHPSNSRAYMIISVLAVTKGSSEKPELHVSRVHMISQQHSQVCGSK